MNKKIVHPYIPNSNPRVKAEMLREIGVETIEELYSDIPEVLRLTKNLNLPKALNSEVELKRHVDKILAKNRTCDEAINFLGCGCYHHYVPAICDEINSRSEFLTAYAGEPYEDHGRFQALFEYESLMAELLDFDVVNVPTYDWTQAASTSILMAGRITGRSIILVSDTVSPDRFSANAAPPRYCRRRRSLHGRSSCALWRGRGKLARHRRPLPRPAANCRPYSPSPSRLSLPTARRSSRPSGARF